MKKKKGIGSKTFTSSHETQREIAKGYLFAFDVMWKLCWNLEKHDGRSKQEEKIYHKFTIKKEEKKEWKIDEITDK